MTPRPVQPEPFLRGAPYPAAGEVQVSEYHGPPTIFSRVQLATPPDLNEYAGAYITDELPAKYRLMVVNGKLTVATPKAAAGPLSPTIADSFTGAGDYFLFHRNAKGAVSGFRLWPLCYGRLTADY